MNELSNRIKTFFVVRDKSDGEFVKEIINVFDQAKESENGALIFFDDINLFNINEDSEPIVAVKTGIDQCADNDRIFCIGTCNDSEDFSPAFVRRWKILQMLHPNKKHCHLCNTPKLNTKPSLQHYHHCYNQRYPHYQIMI